MEPIIMISITLAALAAIVTSLIILWTRVIRPAYRFALKTGQVIDVVLDLPEWCESVDYTLEQCKEEVASLKTTVDEHIKNLNNTI